MDRENEKAEVEVLRQQVEELKKEIEKFKVQLQNSNTSNFKMISMAIMANMCQGSPGRHMPSTARHSCEGADALLLEWKKKRIS